jgi:hypothetical protein
MKRVRSAHTAVLALGLLALPGGASAQLPCSGHEMLPSPRPEASCELVKPQILPAPDGAVRALVYPANIDLYGTPDLESLVVIRSSEGKLFNSKSYASPRGANGYYVVNAQWSPDSEFFAFSLSSSGGHSPWSFPIWVYGREKNVFADFNQMIGDNPTLSPVFKFSGPHTLTASTWDKPGSQNKVPVTLDLADAFEKLPPDQ